MSVDKRSIDMGLNEGKKKSNEIYEFDKLKDDFIKYLDSNAKAYPELNMIFTKSQVRALADEAKLKIYFDKKNPTARKAFASYLKDKKNDIDINYRKTKLKPLVK